MENCEVDSQKTFERMVKQPFNSFAIAAARGIVSGRIKGVSPLYVYGEPGVGKTHLLQAIANERLREGAAGVRFVTCEKILNDLLESLRTGRLSEFRQWYRDCRILLIDDIDVMEKVRNLQDELLNLINALNLEGIPVVCSSAVSPKMLRGVESRLISKLMEGLVLDIEVPERSERKVLITAMMKERNIPADIEVKDYFARKSKGMTPSELIGVSNKIQMAMRGRGEISNAEIRRIVENECNAFVGAQADTRLIELADVMDAVQDVCGVSDLMLKRHDRDNPYRDARNVAMYVARKFTTLSLPELSKRFDCCHPTFIRAVKLSEKRISEDEKYKKLVVMVLDKLGYNWEGTM